MRRTPALILSALLLASCDRTLPPEAFEGTTPVMRPNVFFNGTTRSSGVLESRGGAPTRRLQVEGEGRTLPDGQFQLDQRISFDHRAPTNRTWILRQVDAHHYIASLTDASGPVQAEAFGDLFHLTYPMKTPFAGRMEQWLYLQPDGRTVVNEATIRILGIVVAHLSERITHEDP